MIILSVGLQKSGSTLIANLEEELLISSGKRCGQAMVRKKFSGRYIQKITFDVTWKLLLYNILYGSFVIKTHSKPNKYIRFLINSGFAKATYSYRDPRDVMLSAIDHGNRSRAGLDPHKAFIHFENIDNSIPLTIELMKICQQWLNFGKAFFIKYEEFMGDPVSVMKPTMNYLKIDVSENKIRELVREHEANKLTSHNFNKGITYRYKTELTAGQLQICNAAFRKYLDRCGYPV